MGQKFVEMIKKHLALMRTPEFEMKRAADHLERWVDGLLPKDPFVDISALLGFAEFKFC